MADLRKPTRSMTSGRGSRRRGGRVSLTPQPPPSPVGWVARRSCCDPLSEPLPRPALAVGRATTDLPACSDGFSRDFMLRLRPPRKFKSKLQRGQHAVVVLADLASRLPLANRGHRARSGVVLGSRVFGVYSS